MTYTIDGVVYSGSRLSFLLGIEVMVGSSMFRTIKSFKLML